MSSKTSSSQDFKAFLAPIPGKRPCGESLRYTDIYDKIREARREEDEKLPQGVWKTEVKKADWDQVNKLCSDALKNRSKDLQITAWLIEAWLHLDGIQGLAHGLDLMLKLTRKFWNDIHPELKENEFELRVVPYEWINSRLSEECQQIQISVPSDPITPPYCLLDYNEANRLELSPKKGSSQSTLDKLPSLSKISLSIDQTPKDFYRGMEHACISALQLMSELEEELRGHIGSDAPSFYKLREKVDTVHRFARHTLEHKGEKKEVKKAALEKEAPMSSQKKAFSEKIESREQAYAILAEVATYLERIEPHSPTPYLIHRAISWGKMNLSEVFQDTLQGNHDLGLLLDLLNIKKE
jgi:type VI secretion system protein ImpA